MRERLVRTTRQHTHPDSGVILVVVLMVALAIGVLAAISTGRAETDAFFRFLYAIGTVSEKTLKHIWVYNPSVDSGVQDRFERLLGPGARARFRYIPMPFNNAITNIKEQFSA